MMGIAGRPITVCAGSGPVIRDIRDEDLHVRVVKKYQDLQKNMRKPGKLAATVTATTTATDSVENAPSCAAVIPTTSRSTLQSRERGKLEDHVHKFEKLLEASEFANQKYRAALTESLISERREADCAVLDLPGGVLVWMDDSYKRGDFFMFRDNLPCLVVILEREEEITRIEPNSSRLCCVSALRNM
ncbi:hypothetical protein M405DRAFT_899847 [Rhizopogon salebrosus TDB-379]|nr:hypothetical protein M405DRAFT_899847 [Rhizopogon salebrosus TDB-379]